MGTVKVQEWRYRKEDIDLADHIARKLEVHPLLARLLVARDILDVGSVYDVLHPSLRNLHDPFQLGDIDRAVDRIADALSEKEGITIHGDYDVDGITSTALLFSILKDGSGKGPTVFLPSRFGEGYGISPSCIDEMAERGDSLLITVDTGIKAFDEITLAKEKGMDVIVTDHHEPGVQLPPADIVIDPKIEGDHYPFKELAGVGVSFKLATALQIRGIVDKDVREVLDLVAIGTISDLVPLIDENRSLVHFGLQKLANTNRTGLQTLMREVGMEPWKGVNAGDISFKIGPRLNAAGRLGHPDMALDLILTEDRIDSDLFSRELSTLNYKRQSIGKKLVEEIIEQISALGFGDDPSIVVSKEGWNPGVIGISASKVLEATGRPTVVLSVNGDLARGSSRAPRGFNMVDALDSMDDILIEHGGHERAAGLTIRSDLIPEFRSRLNDYVDKKHPENSFIPILDIDLDLAPSEIDIASIQSLDKMGPFGMGNPNPIISLREVAIGYDIKTVGDGKHLKFSVDDMDRSIDCIWFGMGEMKSRLSPGMLVTIAGQPDIHKWGGNENVQIRVIDMSLIE